MNLSNRKHYWNGNYRVILHEDGTKIRITNDDKFEPVYPETIDINISNRCANGCAHCYIDATPSGLVAPLEEMVSRLVIPYGTEVALNLNSVAPPGFEKFLYELGEVKRVIVNITVNSMNLRKFRNDIIRWQNNKWIHGVGISLNRQSDVHEAFEPNEDGQTIKNIVWHVVNGWNEYGDILRALPQKSNLLILGFKNRGRGKTINPCTNLPLSAADVLNLIKYFNIVSMDNLAIDQTGIMEHLSAEQKEMFYMGDEGEFSMYIDLVTKKYAVSSTHETLYPIPKDRKINIASIFDHVRTMRG